MEKNPIKIVGIEFSETCPKHLIVPTKKYYQLNDSWEFEFKPGAVMRNFNLAHQDMRTIRKETKLICNFLCSKCQDYIKFIITDQSHFKREVNELLGITNTFLCADCSIIEKKIKQKKYELRKKRKRKKAVEKNKKIIHHLNQAIDHKRWRELSPFQYKLLNNCITLNSVYELRYHYFYLYSTEPGLKKFMEQLKFLADKKLIMIETHYDPIREIIFVEDYDFLERLETEFEYDYEVEEHKPKNKRNIETVKAGFTNSLKMRLTINDYQNHPDSPLYAGKVIFKEKIVIDPDIEYVFGQWERKNDDLYFTLVPAHELDKLPVQKKLSNEPKAVQEHITDYLNNITIDK